MERKIKITVTLSPRLTEMLEEIAEKRGIKKTLIMMNALEKYYRDEMRDSDGK